MEIPRVSAWGICHLGRKRQLCLLCNIFSLFVLSVFQGSVLQPSRRLAQLFSLPKASENVRVFVSLSHLAKTKSPNTFLQVTDFLSRGSLARLDVFLLTSKVWLCRVKLQSRQCYFTTPPTVLETYCKTFTRYLCFSPARVIVNWVVWAGEVFFFCSCNQPYISISSVIFYYQWTWLCWCVCFTIIIFRGGTVFVIFELRWTLLTHGTFLNSLLKTASPTKLISLIAL